MEDVCAFVLAGGRSSRMGTDKALLPFGDGNLLQLAVRKARELTPQAVIVGRRDLYAEYGEVIEDKFPGCGPLGGIQAALCTTRSDANLILSVDMPLVTVDFLRWLLQIAGQDEAQATVPLAAGRLQPLCAVYRRGVLEAVESQLHEGNYKVDRILSRLTTRRICEEELHAAGFTPEIFCNLNTPAEYNAITSPPHGPEGRCR